MKLVIFGLAVSSSWGNGHATHWRALCRALTARGHTLVFFEHDVPDYATHRDLWTLPGGGRLHLYESWDGVRRSAEHDVADADVVMITSCCPDALSAEAVVGDACRGLRVFYDLDTPITLERVASQLPVNYIGPHLLTNYDLVLSSTGGASLDALRAQLGARRAVPLYESVDPVTHQPVAPVTEYAAELSYIGTYSADRQERLERLFLEPARRCPSKRFLLAGSQYPDDFPWPANVFYKRHLEAGLHPPFYSSSRLTLNITRRPMAERGYCPSGRLFEAAACGAPLLSDWWPGLEEFFEPGREILVANTTDEAMAECARSDEELACIAARARERTLAEHTADRRAATLEHILSAGRLRETPIDAHAAAGLL